MKAVDNQSLMTRRHMLERSAAGFGMLGLAGVLGKSSVLGNTVVPSSPVHPIARAKRVIFLFMNGGPSQFDTFDPKPALKRFEGQHPDGKLYKASSATGYYPSPFAFKRHGQSGLDVNETLPELAKVIDDCCVIKSMKTDIPNHEPALIQMHTGNIQPIRPSFGAWMMYGLGATNQNLPGYVVLRPSPKIVVGPALWSNSFLPAKYQATSIDTSDLKIESMLSHIKNPKFNLKQQREQVDLLRRLNQLHRKERSEDSALEAEIQAKENA